MAYKLGINCKLYRNTNTYASPTWVEVENVRDLTKSFERGESDLTTRGYAAGGWEATVAVLLSGTVDFGMVYDSADVDFVALEDAFYANTAVEFAMCDGAITTTGTKGLRATFSIMKFGENQPLKEGVTVDVSMKVSYATNAPSRFTI